MKTIEKVAEQHASHLEQVKPGLPERFTEASTVGDAIAQGDLMLIIVASIPEGLKLVQSTDPVNRQLVPGNTQGARHCLDSLEGVDLYRPEDWNEDSNEGPAFKLTKERTVMHPKHGDVTIPAGFIVECVYQREYDQEQKRERLAKD